MFGSQKKKWKLTDEEIRVLIVRIFEEEENKAKFNGIEFKGLTSEQVRIQKKRNRRRMNNESS